MTLRRHLSSLWQHALLPSLLILAHSSLAVGLYAIAALFVDSLPLTAAVAIALLGAVSETWVLCVIFFSALAYRQKRLERRNTPPPDFHRQSEHHLRLSLINVGHLPEDEQPKALARFGDVLQEHFSAHQVAAVLRGSPQGPRHVHRL